MPGAAGQEDLLACRNEPDAAEHCPGADVVDCRRHPQAPKPVVPRRRRAHLAHSGSGQPLARSLRDPKPQLLLIGWAEAGPGLLRALSSAGWLRPRRTPAV